MSGEGFSEETGMAMRSRHQEQKRLRFTPDDDLALLREFVSQNPLADSEKWETIQKNILEITGKKFSLRTLKDHLFLILEVWLQKDENSQRKSGVEEIYSERVHLLQEVSDICKGTKVINLAKRKKNVSKEKQIAELGKRSRDQFALQYSSPLEFHDDNEGFIKGQQEVISFKNASIEHEYSLSSPIVEPIVDVYCEEVIIDERNSDPAVQENLLPQVLQPSGQQKITQEESKVVDAHVNATKKKEVTRILGPRKNRNNASGPLRKTALEYLHTKEEKDRQLKAKQLELEAKRLELEERKIRLDEKRFELEANERLEKFKLERERIEQELLERNQSSKIIEFYQQLIQTLLGKLSD